MSSSELLKLLGIIEDRSIDRERRLRELMRISRFDLNVIIPNMKFILKTLVSLAKYVEAGGVQEQEVYGVLLLEISKVLVFSPENSRKTFEFIKKVFSAFPRVLSGRSLLYTVEALKYFISTNRELIFDGVVKEIYTKALWGKDLSLRREGLKSLLYVLWVVPWATNYYIDVLKPIMTNESDPLHDSLFEGLSVIAEKSFLSVKPIVDMIIKSYDSPLKMPPAVIRFIASLNIPIYKKEDLKMIGGILEEVALKHKDVRIRGVAIISLANLYKNAVFIEEKRRLLKIIQTLVEETIGMSDGVNIALACLKALSIPVWGNVEVPHEIIRRLLNVYNWISDVATRFAFIDVLFATYSNIPSIFPIVAEFLVNEIIRTVDTEFLKKLTDTLQAIISSALSKNVIEEVLRQVLGLYQLPEDKLGPFQRLWLAENILIPIARIYPEVILDFTEDLIKAYKKTFDVTLYEVFARVAFEALKRYPNHENARMLFRLLLSSPSYEETYDVMLELLANLAHKFQDELVENLDIIVKTYVAIRKAQKEITDIGERYYVVDKAIKDLIRILNAIRPVLKQESAQKCATLLIHIYVTAPPDVIRDAEYLLEMSKDSPLLFNALRDAIRKFKIPSEKIEKLRQLGYI